jgi:hypothetical protein
MVFISFLLTNKKARPVAEAGLSRPVFPPHRDVLPAWRGCSNDNVGDGWRTKVFRHIDLTEFWGESQDANRIGVCFIFLRTRFYPSTWLEIWYQGHKISKKEVFYGIFVHHNRREQSLVLLRGHFEQPF